MRAWVITIFLVGAVCSNALARVGETREEVEARYGAPVHDNHAMFGNSQIAALREMPTKTGVVAAADLEIALFEMYMSPYAKQAAALLENGLKVPNLTDGLIEKAKKRIEDSQNLKKLFQPKLYLYEGILVQVVYIGETFSISEAYYELEEDKSAVVAPMATDTPAHPMNEWFRLGDFSYRVNSVRVSNSVVSANDLENQLASTVRTMATAELAKSGFSRANDSEGGERFIIVDYDIRNEGNAPAVVLTDDFVIEDENGRKFSPDGEVAKVLIDTSDKAVITEVLQPGIERHCYQGFRVPTAVVSGAITLVVPEKGILGSKKGRVIIKDGITSSFTTRAIESQLLRSIIEKTLERKTLPAKLDLMAKKAEPGYYDYINSKWGVNYSSQMALNFNDTNALSRVFLNFDGRSSVGADDDDSGWKLDPLYERKERGPLMTNYEMAQKIREAIKQAEEDAKKLKKVDGF